MLWDAIGFYGMALFLIFFALKTITVPNPIHAALYLVLTMIGLAGMFFNLGAHFIAGVQMIVYAGAVMVLFVMVLMLFDLKAEIRSFSRGLLSGALKIMSSALLVGFALGSAGSSVAILDSSDTAPTQIDVTRQLGVLLYTKYLFAFEVLGILLLVVAVGVVAVSRMKGGTHAQH
ncbi:MAG: NADH-quinone oxidoreductase subunit J [Bdellovibrionales bacterium]|nr:NADH-quinone oxidoreductase subunit J [Bdellovibrionales bacterium]